MTDQLFTDAAELGKDRGGPIFTADARPSTAQHGAGMDADLISVIARSAPAGQVADHITRWLAVERENAQRAMRIRADAQRRREALAPYMGEGES
jgi:hypothetical protein